jgi:DNA invertase Pin-like site-specific DNA recombinase
MLARSSNDLYNIIAALTKKGVKFHCIQQSGVDPDSGIWKLILAILGRGVGGSVATALVCASTHLE